ncbi:hypothetical protein [Photorhabdus akhurstii]|nr:hypothetical protein [Photorhabdus akhurstii]
MERKEMIVQFDLSSLSSVIGGWQAETGVILLTFSPEAFSPS